MVRGRTLCCTLEALGMLWRFEKFTGVAWKSRCSRENVLKFTVHDAKTGDNALIAVK
jgi:hypothetical protein